MIVEVKAGWMVFAFRRLLLCSVELYELLQVYLVEVVKLPDMTRRARRGCSRAEDGMAGGNPGRWGRQEWKRGMKQRSHQYVYLLVLET